MLALVELTGKRRGAAARPVPDGDGFRDVVQRRAGAMSVDVVNVLGRDAGDLRRPAS